MNHINFEEYNTMSQPNHTFCTMPAQPALRHTLTTADAAKALNRAPQTLRTWACYENGPIRPIHIHGRLAWPVDEIAALLQGNPGRR